MGLLKRIDELELTLRGASYISLEQREYLNRLKAIVEELEKYKANSQEEIRRNEDIINRLSKKVDHLEGRVENVAKKREIVDLDVRVVCELSDELDKAPIAEALRDYAKQYPRRKFSINFRGGRYDSIDSIISVFRGDRRVCCLFKKSSEQPVCFLGSIHNYLTYPSAAAF